MKSIVKMIGGASEKEVRLLCGVGIAVREAPKRILKVNLHSAHRPFSATILRPLSIGVALFKIKSSHLLRTESRAPETINKAEALPLGLQLRCSR